MSVIKYAKEQVDYIDGSPEMAAHAFIATSRALASTNAGHLHAQILQAEKCTRDHLIWRTQLRTAIGDRS
eukprot:1298645-Heterocapsa_arctica.AAC.1